MKHYLIRAGMSPFDNFTPAYEIVNNSIGSNVGNLVYAYSIFRTLTMDDVKLTPDYYKIEPKKADYINDTYDGYIIPLADAFRPKFASKLAKYTELINRLNIPVYVIGVGLSADFEPNLDEAYPFDEEVKAFVKAVLKKSSIIGVRGDITSRYLTKLGFKEGVDHIAIGCPSMYGFGRDLKVRETTITEQSLVTINNSPKSPDNVLDFIERSVKVFNNHYYIPQWLRELRMIYLGGPNLSKKRNFPANIEHSFYQENRVRYFTNVPTWLDFIGKADLSFGARLHGNIAAILAGTPSIIIPKDGRMRELVEYHNLNCVWPQQINEQTQILDIVEQSDFQKVAKSAPANFDRYIQFLEQNGLDHIYKENPNPTGTSFDQKIQSIDFLPSVKSFTKCTHGEMIDRWLQIVEEENKLEKTKSKVIQEELQNKIIQLNKKIKHQEGTLNRKSVKLALKTANIFSKK
ncbi:polysaccharide pyruvyl transferase family protein [Rummeliibacillus sp. POC4]|uniref:polysaccharide pyruvyl transferase family protein n=1 Tax=Rummeliibacillus sp. POC4 TaxID=2305899 RepID=UPI000E6618F0|nr:polysaccharide pyruvyl transferase family protein [Rummeliibacillus sp. POC4]RIJ65634.1 polysaccharide pyruvyl transferase family protein [Rummeliibacillus sp. POC4]